MRLQYIAEFITLAETLNYTVAARSLYLTQPTLSKHIQALESDLGTQLFERTTHTVVLTEDGRQALESLRRIHDEYTALQATIAGRRAGTSGTITIGAPYHGLHEWLSPIVHEVDGRIPQMTLHVLSMQPHQIVAGLEEGSMDVGLLMRTPALAEESFAFQHLAYADLYVIRARGAGRAESPTMDVREIEGETLVIVSLDKQYTDVTMGLLARAGVTPAAVVDAGQIDFMPTKLRSTGGVFIGPHVLKHVAPDDLSLSPIISPVPMRLDMGFYTSTSSRNPGLPVFLGVCAEFQTPGAGVE